MDELVGGAGLVLGDVLQVDGLLQQDLPLDPSPVVSLNRIDHLTHGNTGRYVELNTSFMNNKDVQRFWIKISESDIKHSSETFY